MRNFLNLFLLINFLFHVFLSAGFELAHDEAYYWLYSKNLSWGYFDHPPFVALVIKAFSFLPPTELSLRLGFLILQVCTILVLLTFIEKDKKWLATKLFLAFPLSSSLGLFALPDMPLLFMSAVYIYFLSKYLIEDNSKNVIFLSLSIAGLFYAKYHGIILILFTLLALPKLFTKKSFYLVFLMSLILFLPHLIWQYHHHFSTLKYHFLERPSSDFSLKRVVEFLGGQLFINGLFVGPFIWFVAFKKKSNGEFERVLKFISFGTITFFFVSILNKKFEANWTIFLVVPLILFVINDELWKKKAVSWALNLSIVFILITKTLLIFDPQTIPVDRLKEFHGWKKFALEVKSKCSAPIVANTYQIASKLSFYLDEQIHSVNLGSRKNQFDIWSLGDRFKNQKVCFVTNKKNFLGEKINSPDSKNLIIVSNLDYNEILREKIKSN